MNKKKIYIENEHYCIQISSSCFVDFSSVAWKACKHWNLCRTMAVEMCVTITIKSYV